MSMAVNQKVGNAMLEGIYNDAETGYTPTVDTRPIETFDDVQGYKKKLEARFTPEGRSPDEFNQFGDRTKFHSRTLETARMLQDTGMPPGMVEGGEEAVDALKNFEAAVNYARGIARDGERVLSEQRLSEINKLVNGIPLDSGEDVIRDFAAKSENRKRGGAVWHFPPPGEIKDGLREIVEWQKVAINSGQSVTSVAKGTADLLVRLHPYAGGNGRTAMVIEKFYEVSSPAAV